MADGSLRATRTIRAADLFCGAGGTSTGAARAARSISARLQLTAVNHWPVALETHAAMHPGAEHICADLESVRPCEVVPDGRLDLLMASPTCTYHSRARGGRPVNDQQRMDPWHVHRWCCELRVARLLVENVPEFIDWGPCSLVTGRPIESRKGEYFRAWCDALRSIGFRLDFRVLCCADYGDPTTRQRFFLIGRSDGKALRWPEPTHARGGATDLLGTRKPWRSAAECIDWSQPGTSIFTRKRPLKPNTIRRLLAGAQRYNWPQPHVDALQALLDGHTPHLDLDERSAAPFLVHFRGTEPSHIAGAALNPSEPLPTLTGGGRHVGLIMAIGSDGAARPLQEPVPTIVGGGNGARPHFAQPIVLRANVSHGRDRDMRSAGDPLATVTCGDSLAVASPLIAPYYGGGSGQTSQSAAEPLPAITTKARFGVAEPIIVSTSNSSCSGVPRAAADPLRTITTARGGDMAVASPVLLRAAHGDSDGRNPATRVLDPTMPMPTLTGSNEVGLASPFLVPNWGERAGQQPRVHGVDAPLPTIAAGGHIQLAQAAVCSFRIDILYRMLTVRELARAMSFDVDGEVYPFAGNATEITKQIGNAVPCRTAEALVRALVLA